MTDTTEKETDDEYQPLFFGEAEMIAKVTIRMLDGQLSRLTFTDVKDIIEFYEAFIVCISGYLTGTLGKSAAQHIFDITARLVRESEFPNHNNESKPQEN